MAFNGINDSICSKADRKRYNRIIKRKEREFRCRSEVFYFKLNGKCPSIFTFAPVLRKYHQLFGVSLNYLCRKRNILKFSWGKKWHIRSIYKYLNKEEEREERRKGWMRSGKGRKEGNLLFIWNFIFSLTDFVPASLPQDKQEKIPDGSKSLSLWFQTVLKLQVIKSVFYFTIIWKNGWTRFMQLFLLCLFLL